MSAARFDRRNRAGGALQYSSGVYTGMPQASPAEIDRRWAICQACELFDGSICAHKSCGCNVSNEQKFLNKLAWAEQKCPAGKW